MPRVITDSITILIDHDPDNPNAWRRALRRVKAAMKREPDIVYRISAMRFAGEEEEKSIQAHKRDLKRSIARLTSLMDQLRSEVAAAASQNLFAHRRSKKPQDGR